MEIQTDVLSVLRICLCEKTCKGHTTLSKLVNNNSELKARVVIYYKDKDGIYKEMDREEEASQLNNTSTPPGRIPGKMKKS